MSLPTSFRGLLALIAVVLFVIIVMYASTVGTMLVGGVILAVGVYVVYLLGYRVDKWLKHGSLR